MLPELLVADLSQPRIRTRRHGAAHVRAVEKEDISILAELYFAGYPAPVGARTIGDAVLEMSRTFDGEYGEVLYELSLLAAVEGAPAGAVLTTARSVWGDPVDAPFVIDFFVHPAHRRLGVGRLLLENLLERASDSGASQLALRVNEGTGPAALHLYSCLGFRRPAR
jgi:GNAT superfamily N-acetyltransferase